jgi:DNA-binding LacI/PurR family transcriptional regulator
MRSIHQVARYAGVSAATVSRVINGTKYVSPETRERVLRAIEELGFQPSAAARNLRLQQTRIIGVLLPSLEDYFFGRLAFVIEKALLSRDYRPLFCSTENSPHKEADYLSMLTAQRVDGLLMVPTLATQGSIEQIQAVTGKPTPTVLLEAGIPALSVSQVIPANRQGGYKAGRHLLDLGHRDIAIITPGNGQRPPVSGGGYERIAGMQDAFRERGILWNPAFIVDDLKYIEMGYYGARVLVEQHPQVTAAFALTDQIAIGVLRQLQDMGRRAPDDLSVIGYGGLPISEHLIPRLTTVAQPVEHMGSLAVDILLRQIAEPETPVERVTLDTELIVRESTAAPRA